MGMRVIYIVARSRSGSTLLTQLLSAHSAVASVGEAKHLVEERPIRCGCGLDDWRECGFWQSVESRLLAAGGTSLAAAGLRSSDPAVFQDANRRLFEAVAAQAGVEWVVDSSKDLSRLRRLLDTDLDVRVIHLIRDPRGVVSSTMRRGTSLETACREYVSEHVGARHLLRDRSHLELRYEDLAGAPVATLDRLMGWLGLTVEPQQLRGWRQVPRHDVGGNKMRFEATEDIRLDERWRTELSRAQRLRILALTLPVRLSALRGRLSRATRWAPRRRPRRRPLP